MTTSPPAYWQPEAEGMDREELEQLQLERLQGTLQRVYRNVPFYRRRFDELGLDPDEVRSPDALQALPFTTKQDLIDAYPYALFAVPLREVVRLQASGGTGSAAIVLGYTRNDIKTWSNLVARTLVGGGVTRDDVVQITFDYGLLTGAMGLHYGAERLGASVIPTSSGNAKRQIKIMQDYKTTVLVGTPSYALHLAQALEDAAVSRAALSLRRALLGGEPWSEAMRREIQERLQVTATDNYGLSEVMGPGIAGECLERAGLHLAEDHFLAEVIDPATLRRVAPGEAGELVITTLTKEAFPLIRYRTRDLTSLVLEPCPCGRTSLRLRRIQGRTDDMVIIRGVTVHPSAVESVLRAVEGGEPRYQLVVERLGALDQATVLVEVSESRFSDEVKRQGELRDRVARRLASELGVTFEVRLVSGKTLDETVSQGKVVDRRQG